MLLRPLVRAFSDMVSLTWRGISLPGVLQTGCNCSLIVGGGLLYIECGETKRDGTIVIFYKGNVFIMRNHPLI